MGVHADEGPRRLLVDSLGVCLWRGVEAKLPALRSGHRSDGPYKSENLGIKRCSNLVINSLRILIPLETV